MLMGNGTLGDGTGARSRSGDDNIRRYGLVRTSTRLATKQLVMGEPKIAIKFKSSAQCDRIAALVAAVCLSTRARYATAQEIHGNFARFEEAVLAYSEVTSKIGTGMTDDILSLVVKYALQPEQARGDSDDDDDEDD